MGDDRAGPQDRDHRRHGALRGDAGSPPTGPSCSIHDASFATAEAERAAETGHSTARQAAELAAEAEVRMLALVHISSRHFVPDILAEARGVCPEAVAPRDFDLVEIPLPERGAPVLVENGRAGPSRRRLTRLGAAPVPLL